MKEQMNYYKHYEKFMKMNLEQSIVKTSEYRDFVEIYPHITESIRLKREIERLTKKMKSEKAPGKRPGSYTGKSFLPLKPPADGYLVEVMHRRGLIPVRRF